MQMKISFCIILLMITAVVGSVNGQNTKSKSDRSEQQKSSLSAKEKETEQKLLNLSKDKWQWMSERKVESLDSLLHEKAVFVHMGATMTKPQELEVIRSGAIVYKTVDIQDESVRFVGTTAIVLHRIRLVAVVGGNEVTNPFMVTEVYVPKDGAWTLASLSFTRLLTPP